MRQPSPAAPDDLTLLRLHVAACWGLYVPSLAPGASDAATVMRDAALILDPGDEPHWALYMAATARGMVMLWRDGVRASARPALLARAAAARELPEDARPPDGVGREVALGLRAPARISLAQARRLARRLKLGDGPLFEQFERDSAAYFTDPRKAPVFGVVRGGRLLAIAHSSRRTSQACELGVETLPEARKHGYALAATMRWASAVAGEGIVPLYSARADNDASLALAAAAGYRPFARATYVAP